jgi:hypothetical protein
MFQRAGKCITSIRFWLIIAVFTDLYIVTQNYLPEMLHSFPVFSLLPSFFNDF